MSGSESVFMGEFGDCGSVMGERFTEERFSGCFLRTARLQLRPLCEADYGELQEMLCDPAVMQAWGRPLRAQEVRFWLDNQYDRYRLYGFGEMAVILRGSGEFLGQAGLVMQSFDGHLGLEIAYMLKPRYWGFGYATEAAAGCRRHAFERLGAGQVGCSIRDDNSASLKVARRLGMQYSGSAYKRVMGKEYRHLLFLSRRPAVLVREYDAEWADLFERLRLFLLPLLEEESLRLAHVGGTAVVGLASQPVIDAALAGCPGSSPDWSRVRRRLEDEFHFQADVEDDCFFDKSSRLRFLHQLILCPAEGAFESLLAERELLASSPVLCAAYGQSKLQASVEHAEDSAGYELAKRAAFARIHQATGR